jgi:hypothetical protein
MDSFSSFYGYLEVCSSISMKKLTLRLLREKKPLVGLAFFFNGLRSPGLFLNNPKGFGEN